MSFQPREATDGESWYRIRADEGPSPTVALLVSLVVHAVLVTMLYKAYSELAVPPLALTIVAAEPTPCTWAEPIFAIVPPSFDEQAPCDEYQHPVATVAPLARRSIPVPAQSSMFASRILPRNSQIDSTASPSRAIIPATLPATTIPLPSVPTVSPIVTAATPAVAPRSTPLQRFDTPPRTAMLTTVGPLPPGEIRTPLPAVGAFDQLGGRERQPTRAFSHRLRDDSFPPENAVTIDRGLDFLARVQCSDGRWQFENTNGHTNLRADAAATGLALLAFLGAGHDHFDGRYRLVVEDGLRFLVHSQQMSWATFPDNSSAAGATARFYSHGIATLALCEAVGMTGDAELRTAAQQALDRLAEIDAAGANSGGSVAGWQLAALKCGQLAGLNVRPAALERIALEISRERTENSRLQRPIPPRNAEDEQARAGQIPSTVTTAVRLAVDLHLGGSPSDQRLQPAAEHLLAHPPEVDVVVDTAETQAASDPRRDTYYWYYGTQAMSHLGGEYWRGWSAKLHPRLIQSQVRDGPLAGSWDPPPLENHWAIYGGRLYVTSMNLLSLEVYTRDPQLASQPANQAK